MNAQTSLGQVANALDSYRLFVAEQVRRARAEPEFAAQLDERWQTARSRVGTTVTPTGLTLPRHALPDLDEAGAIARYLFEEGLPGDFPFLNAAYAEMYLAPDDTPNGKASNGHGKVSPDRIEDQPAPTPAGGAVGGALDSDASELRFA